MRLEDLSRLAGDLWKGSIFKEQAKLSEMLNKYDKDQKGGLSLC